MARYQIVQIGDSHPRRRRLFGQSVAVDYWAGVAWIVCIPIAVLLLVFSVMLSGELLTLFSYTTLLTCVILVLTLTTISVTALVVLLIADPGVVTVDAPPLLSHHCPVCNWDVSEFDHHCPVIGGCIGLGTMRYFITFAASTFVLCLVTFVVCFAFVLHVSHEHAVMSSLWKTPKTFVPLVFRTYTSTTAHLLAVAFCIAAIYGGLACFGLAAIHLIFSATGRFSVERRRQPHVNPGIRYVFAGYFHPKTARRALDRLSVSQPV